MILGATETTTSAATTNTSSSSSSSTTTADVIPDGEEMPTEVDDTQVQLDVTDSNSTRTRRANRQLRETSRRQLQNNAPFTAAPVSAPFTAAPLSAPFTAAPLSAPFTAAPLAPTNSPIVAQGPVPIETDVIGGLGSDVPSFVPSDIPSSFSANLIGTSKGSSGSGKGSGKGGGSGKGKGKGYGGDASVSGEGSKKKKKKLPFCKDSAASVKDSADDNDAVQVEDDDEVGTDVQDPDPTTFSSSSPTPSLPSSGLDGAAPDSNDSNTISQEEICDGLGDIPSDAETKSYVLTVNLLLATDSDKADAIENMDSVLNNLVEPALLGCSVNTTTNTTTSDARRRLSKQILQQRQLQTTNSGTQLLAVDFETPVEDTTGMLYLVCFFSY